MAIKTSPETTPPAETPALNGLQNPGKPGELTSFSALVERTATYILSLVLALVVWLIAVNEQNPLVQDFYQNPVLIEVRGPDEGLSPKSNLTERPLELEIRAPRTSWESMDEKTDFIAYVDLTGLPAGSHIVQVVVDQVDPRVDIVGQNPTEFTIELEEVITKTVPVRITVDGVAADGYRLLEPIPSEESVMLSGRTSQLAQVTHVGGAVELEGTEKNQVEAQIVLQPRDGQNKEVSDVAVEPAEVTVVIPIEQAPGRKEVAVRPDLTGEPAGGYRLSSLRVEPSSVILAGAADVLAQVPGSVETSVFSLDGATADFSRPVELLLPEGVTTVDGRNTVMVAAAITPIEGGKTITHMPIIDGLAPEYEAEVALDSVDVIISGPVSLLDSLEADDMFVILDLAGLVPGVHNVRPQVVLPDGVRQEAVIPETVEVVIKAKAEADAAATASAGSATPLPTALATEAPEESP